MTTRAFGVRIAMLLASMLTTVLAAHAEQTNNLETLKEALQRQEQALAAQYGSALDASLQSLKQKGDIDTYLVVETEKKRFEAEKTVPAPADAKDAFRLAVESYSRGTADSLRKYMAALDGFIKQEMMADRMESAKEAKEEKTRVEFLLADAKSKTPIPEPVMASVPSSPDDASTIPPATSEKGVPTAQQKKQVTLTSMDSTRGQWRAVGVMVKAGMTVNVSAEAVRGFEKPAGKKTAMDDHKTSYRFRVRIGKSGEEIRSDDTGHFATDGSPMTRVAAVDGDVYLAHDGNSPVKVTVTVGK